MSNPIVKIKSGPSPTQTGVQNAVLQGLAPVLSSVSTAADLFPFNPKELFSFLHFRIQTARQAKKRESWIGGKFYNRVSVQSADYVPLSGTHLSQTFSAAGIQPPEFVVARGEYELRLDYAEKAYERLRKMLEEAN